MNMQSSALKNLPICPVVCVSGGLAGALVGEPQFIFYGEPTTGLNPVISEQIDNLIIELAWKN